MNTAQIKAYAPKARRDFIQAVTNRARLFGLAEDPKNIKPMVIKGDVALINGNAFPAAIGRLRERIEARIRKDGFAYVMEQVAYTWFNRFMALRYMELHGYLSHGYRVLSNRDGSLIPEILDHAMDIDLPGLNRDEVIELKLAGNRDEELYALLIKAQCHALHNAMPFLFERIDDETELLMPDNLLHSGSVIRKLVEEIDEESWEKVEIIGWIYQFYISEKKEQVIGKVVKSEDIPAATQLFTPNWIVKYMVQNSLGRKWLATYPDSPIRKKMEYYIEPAEQDPDVQAAIDADTPKALNPEEITLIDPACGSGHILVEAYDIFKEIYLERGYRTRDIPRLILEKNLYGLDIDDRAAQLTGFALMMKARADNRRIFEMDPPIDLRHFRSIKSSACIDGAVIADALVRETEKPIVDDDLLFPETRKQQILTVPEKTIVTREDIFSLVELFKHGKTFGSLIMVPEDLAAKLPAMHDLVNKDYHGDWNRQDKAQQFRPFVEQAIILARKYDCVVANPPYMGWNGMNVQLKTFLQKIYKDMRSDLFSAFIIRIMEMTIKDGFLGMMTPFNWMFLSSFEKLRYKILDMYTLTSLVRPEFHAFFDSAYVSICGFSLKANTTSKFKGTFIDLGEFYGTDIQPLKTLEGIKNPSCGWCYSASAEDFKKIPGAPIAYWETDRIREIFYKTDSLDKYAKIGKGLDTGNNDRFLKLWFEVSRTSTKWIPCLKGGPFRKWYGNFDYVINWGNDGEELKTFVGSNLRNANNYFKSGITWTRVSCKSTAFRRFDEGFVFESTGPCIFPQEIDKDALTAFLNSKLIIKLLKIIAPTLDFQSGHICKIPCLPRVISISSIKENASRCIDISRIDWDFFENSWDFSVLPLREKNFQRDYLEKSYFVVCDHWRSITQEMQRLEEENNRIFIEAYGLQDELTPEVPLNEITLTCNPYYRYGNNRSEEELEVLLQADTMKELISYSIGCMMGRYSLDEQGLIYAHSGNIGFDPNRYKTFPADEDGIVPIMDINWFEDDATNRFVEFIKIAWPEEHLDENLKFIAESLGPKAGETPKEAIRRYMSTGFFRDHLKMYKRRPIYWLFSSGKHKAFECLVYLHRYNESTLSRMRSSYVTPLQGKINSRIEYLEHESKQADSTATLRDINKKLDLLRKKQLELRAFDDELRHFADRKISIDLDDGVKVNYGRFGNLLAEVKAVTGKG